MDILSKDTLTLLRDANVREAVKSVLTSDDDGQANTRTVTVQTTESDSSATHQEPTEVTVRRVAT